MGVADVGAITTEHRGVEGESPEAAGINGQGRRMQRQEEYWSCLLQASIQLQA
jgi:hypothetical protein